MCVKPLILLPKYPLAPFPHPLIGFNAAVMKGAEPTVPRHLKCSIVAFKIAVVQLVKEIPHRNNFFVFGHNSLKATMGCNSLQRFDLHMKKKMDRVRKQNPMNHAGAEVQKMLNWVHGHARPRANVDISMMQAMG